MPRAAAARHPGRNLTGAGRGAILAGRRVTASGRPGAFTGRAIMFLHRIPTLLAAVLSLTLPAPVLAAGPVRPNIVLVMTDDQGYGELACHGNPLIRTPNLDQLHRDSVRFTDFHVSPTCSPTRC